MTFPVILGLCFLTAHSDSLFSDSLAVRQFWEVEAVVLKDEPKLERIIRSMEEVYLNSFFEKAETAEDVSRLVLFTKFSDAYGERLAENWIWLVHHKPKTVKEFGLKGKKALVEFLIGFSEALPAPDASKLQSILKAGQSRK